MSWQACYYVKKLRAAPNGERITAYEKLVLLHLADAHNEEKGIAWPSIPTIAADCVISIRHVQNLLHSLERKGVICIIRPEKNGRDRFLCYWFPALDTQDGKGAQHSPLIFVPRNTHKTCTEHAGNPQKRRTIDAKDISAIKEEDRTKNLRTEQQIDRDQIPKGLNQDRGKQVWSTILEHLDSRVDKHSFDTWLKPLKAAGCADGVLWIRVPKPEFKEMVERYTDQINEALTSKEIHDFRTVRFAW